MPHVAAATRRCPTGEPSGAAAGRRCYKVRPRSQLSAAPASAPASAGTSTFSAAAMTSTSNIPSPAGSPSMKQCQSGDTSYGKIHKAIRWTQRCQITEHTRLCHATFCPVHNDASAAPIGARSQWLCDVPLRVGHNANCFCNRRWGSGGSSIAISNWYPGPHAHRLVASCTSYWCRLRRIHIPRAAHS